MTKQDKEELDKINEWIKRMADDNPNITPQMKKYIMKKLLQKYFHCAKVSTPKELWQYY